MQPRLLGRQTVLRFKVDGDDGADGAWTFSENDDAVGNADGLRQIVGHQQGGEFLFPDDIDDVAGDVQTGLVIEGTERFIQQKKVRMSGQGADESRSLAHPSGEFMGMGVGKVGNLVLFHQGADVSDIFFGELAVDLQPQNNVFIYGPVFQQMVFLQHVSDGGMAVAGGVDQRARLHGNQSCRQVKKRGFAAAGRTDDGGKFAGKKVKADVRKGLRLTVLRVIGVGEMSDR